MKFAILQLTSVYDYKENLKKLNSFLSEASSRGASFAYLPECYYSMSDGSKATEFLVHEGNEHFENIRNLAQDNNIGILGGSVAYKEGDVIKNRCYNFDSKGNVLGYYDKNYLFNCSLKNKSVNEA